MAGHSQFKNIMHRKGAQDRKKAKIFNRIGRDITLAVRQSGEDQSINTKLRAAIIAARAANMPNDRVQRAIKSALGTGADNSEEIRYEGYGPGGVALIIEALTDNRMRTAPEIRTVMGKFGGNLGETGSVSFQFTRVGQFVYPAKIGSADAVLEAAIEAGADNAESDAEYHTITTAPENYAAATELLIEKFGSPTESGLVWNPVNTIPVSGDNAAQLIKLIAALEDLDDVQQVFGNFEMDDTTMQRLTA
jgi:YebC/PmpR family DNA-binding regulatory protein